MPACTFVLAKPYPDSASFQPVQVTVVETCRSALFNKYYGPMVNPKPYMCQWLIPKPYMLQCRHKLSLASLTTFILLPGIVATN